MRDENCDRLFVPPVTGSPESDATTVWSDAGA
jgi:hypothetical protein